MKIKIHDQRGFMLVDAIIGIVILALGLVAIAAGYSQLTKNTTATRNYNQAMTLAREQLNNMHKTLDGINKDIEKPTLPEPKKVRNVEYSYAYQDITVSGLDPKITPITVRVSWNEGKNNRHLDMTGYFYRK